MPRLSRRNLEEIRTLLQISIAVPGSRHEQETQRSIERINQALTPSVKRRVAARTAASARRAAKRQASKETRDVYTVVAARAGHFCECGCGQRFSDVGLTGNRTMDHFLGKARSESVETCWMLRRDCHLNLKQQNKPSRAYWLRLFINHCERFGYSETEAWARKELAFVEAKERLSEGVSP